MPLIDCPTCQRPISDQAIACPHCGHPLKDATPQRVTTSEDSALTRNRGCGDILLYGPILLIIVVILVGIFR